MTTPWFMHAHKGKNILVGVFPTPVGVYVRSYVNEEVEVLFYPLDLCFENGRQRAIEHIGLFTDGPEDEAWIDRAVSEHLQEHLGR